MFSAVSLAQAQEAAPIPESFVALQVVERVVLPAGNGRPPSLDVAPLRQQVTLTLDAAWARAFVAARQKDASALCPDIEVDGGTVRLFCRTRQLAAELVPMSPPPGKWALKLEERKGLPWTGPDALPLLAWPLDALGMGTDCPGTRPFAHGECALRDGDLSAAKQHYEQAQNTLDSAWAHLRLGDLHLHEDRPVEALLAYRRVGRIGYAGRLATQRLCDLTNECHDAEAAARAIDVSRLPEPLRTEVELRQVRREAYLGDVGRAAAALDARLQSTGRTPICVQQEGLCHAVTLAALASEEPDSQVQGLALLAHLPHLRSVLDVPLAREAARVAELAEAPLFAAQLLASVTGKVPASELERHLELLHQLYLRADEPARASFVRDFARSRLKRVPSWKVPSLPAAAPTSPPSPGLWASNDGPTDFSQERARAVLARSRARRSAERLQSTP